MKKGTCIKELRTARWLIETGRRVDVTPEGENYFCVATEGCNISIMVRTTDINRFVKLDQPDAWVSVKESLPGERSVRVKTAQGIETAEVRLIKSSLGPSLPTFYFLDTNNNDFIKGVTHWIYESDYNLNTLKDENKME